MKEIERLAHAGYLVFAYDHTGCMESGGEHINGFAQSLADLHSALTVLEKDPSYSAYTFSVVGHSWGGYSTLNIAALHPEITHVVAISGFYFTYNSLERFVYPTPVSYMKKYLWLIVITTIVKFLMIFVFRFLGKKAESSVIKVMAVDGVLDFFVSGVTVLTLVLTKSGGYAYDALCGLVIGIIIMVGAIRLVISSVKAIILE
jgi:pimeloyl-ACP methyl ester carboxylesterase